MPSSQILTRRTMLKASVLTAGGLLVPWTGGCRTFASPSRPPAQPSPSLQKFVQALPGLGPTGIPVALPDALSIPGVLDHYSITMGQYTQQLHPDLPKATTLWGYADAAHPDPLSGRPLHRHLGGLIVAQKNRPVRLTVTNNLPPVHPLPVDTTLPGAELAQNRATVHLHGGHVPWTSDGGPFSWFLPDGTGGISFLNAGGQPGQAEYYYPNDQSARLVWYHDHALGITRLNAYAGLASGYVIRDAAEAALIASGAIPSRELPIIIQDKTFKTVDDQWGRAGDLWYPSVYDADEGPGGPPFVPSIVPEFFGDTMLVNGLVFPFVDVEPRRYRLRILNACNSRFCTLRLVHPQDTTFPASTEPDPNRLGPPFLQIASEGGFLPPTAANPGGVLLNTKKNGLTLLLAPAERADVIVDFSLVPPGSTLLLYNDAPAPFPDGDAATDYYPGNPKNPVVSEPGFGPNTRTLLQFRVGPLVGPADPAPPTLVLPPLDPSALVPLGVTALPPGVRVRDLTLNEDFDQYGRLIQRLGTSVSLHPPTFARDYVDPATETPLAGSTEVWRIFNLTGDTHPIHFHLVNVQVLSRQSFDARHYGPDGVPHFTGPARPPDPNELGWKETVRMNPGECTTVVMKFDLAAVPFAVPPSPRTGGHEYVWHCHILEHEEHDMMRPLVVV